MIRQLADGDVLRATMRRLPSPVVVVTTSGETEARGVTIGSFTSVSLEPPLVSFNIGLASHIHRLLTTADTFAVHVLGEGHVHLADRFARPLLSGVEQFDGVAHHLDPAGLPLLEEALAILICRRRDCFPAGDHTIVVGEVLRVEHLQDGDGILYQNRAYRTIGTEVSAIPLTPAPKKA